MRTVAEIDKHGKVIRIFHHMESSAWTHAPGEKGRYRVESKDADGRTVMAWREMRCGCKVRESADGPQDQGARLAESDRLRVAYNEAMVQAERLGLMRKGMATNRCQCPTCGKVFSTEGNFDRHLTSGRLAEDFGGDWCRDPAGVGLVNDGGVWHRPGPEEPILRSTRKVGAADG